MITIQKVTSNVQSVSRQSPDIYWHAELCSRRPFFSIARSTFRMYSVMAIFMMLVFCTVIVRCKETFWSLCISNTACELSPCGSGSIYIKHVKAYINHNQLLDIYITVYYVSIRYLLRVVFLYTKTSWIFISVQCRVRLDSPSRCTSQMSSSNWRVFLHCFVLDFPKLLLSSDCFWLLDIKIFRKINLDHSVGIHGDNLKWKGLKEMICWQMDWNFIWRPWYALVFIPSNVHWQKWYDKY